MDRFHRSFKQILSETLVQNPGVFQAIEVHGVLGNGKTYATAKVLEQNSLPYVPIVFSEHIAFPFQKLILQEVSGSDEDQFLMSCTILFQKGYILFFQNVEKCEPDHLRLLIRLLEYHKRTGQRAITILEYNTLESNKDGTDKCLNALSALTDISLMVEPVPKEDFVEYLSEQFSRKEKTRSLIEKIVTISNQNLQNFFVTLNILKQEEIICENKGRLSYSKPNEPLPNNLLALYNKLFNNLDNYLQNSLQAAVPFAPNIYSEIIKVIVQNYTNFENYLCELSSFGSFIKPNNVPVEGELFGSEYVFATETASQAISQRLIQGELDSLSNRYYDYLDKIYHNRNEFNLLSESDKLQLLVNLTKNRRGYLTINQISLIIDLMKYYNDHFMYLSAIRKGDCVIEAGVLNSEQLNTEFHEFYLVFFHALLAVGDYGRIIEHKGQFTDGDLNFIIATAFYNCGKPYVALQILEQINGAHQGFNVGHKEHLLASIYDWTGDNKKSFVHFKRALKGCEGDDALKYQLYKGYSMHVDFRLPECKSKMQQACEYYERKDLKQLAECLHNYGTGCVMIFAFEEAKKHLEKSKDILSKTCNEEIYYPMNSLAILTCMQSRDFDAAISIWNEALKHHIRVEFCMLALQNNRFNTYIHQGDLNAAQKQKMVIESSFQEMCQSKNIAETLKEKRPDLQHQLRQYYYNCGVFHKVNGELEWALDYFLKAKQCSTYHSIMEYAISENIRKLSDSISPKKRWSFLRERSLLQPTQLEAYIYDYNIYLCEVMFWG